MVGACRLRSRAMTIVQSAELARRSPARFSLRRCEFPVARGAQQRARGFVADTVVGEQRCRDRVKDRLDGLVELGDLDFEGEPTRSDRDQRAFHSTGRREWITRTEPCCELDLAARCAPAQLGADLLGSGVTHCAGSQPRCGPSSLLTARDATDGVLRPDHRALLEAVASPASTARAAISASSRSDFPRRRRR
jgi:hypothetical protein